MSTDLPLLPHSWAWVPMSEVCEKVQDGTHFSPENQQEEGKFPYVTAKNVRPNGLDLSELTYLSEKDHRAIFQRCDPIQGDVLLVKDGVNTGDAAINTLEGEISLLSSVCMLRPRQAVLDNRHLRYFLLSPQGYRLLTGQMTGTAIKRIILRRVRETPVPIAPLHEQRRIVAKIEELFSDLDAGVAALERARANLKRYRAAILKAAVEGKLTEPWRAEHPATEPASELLKRILAERRKKWETDQLAKFAAAGKAPPKDWREKYAEPGSPDVANLPALPEGWCWANIEQLTERSEYGTSVKCDYEADGLPVLRIPNIAKGSIDLSDLKYARDQLEIQDRDSLQVGDLLMCRTNGSIRLIGKAALVSHVYQSPHTFASYLLRFRFGERASLPKWILAYVSSHLGRRFIEAHAASSAGQHNISLSLIHSMPIPLPPLGEQQEAVSLADEWLSAAEKADAEIKPSLHRAARLRQSILKRAFEGKLVAQDPADEPASVLLGRIRESREAELRIRAAKPTRSRPAASGVGKKQPAGNIFRRGAVVCYVVRALADRPSFGRTQLEKVLHLTQSHLGVNLDLEFERYPAGPFDKAIYKLEGFARKRGWFDKEDRPIVGVRYHPGPNIGERYEAAVAILGDKRTAVDELLAHVAGMDADAAELFATVYATWNDLLIDGRPAIDETIIAEVYGWDESKKRFPESRIRLCLNWMRKHGYIPTGTGRRTQPRSPVSEKKSRRGRKTP